MLPTDPKERKMRPIARGVLDYFPDAIAEIARVSYVGNQQHNPGEELHWAREKSTDHADCIVRHLLERGKIDTDGMRHSAKMAWRALALLQLELEAAAEADADECKHFPPGGPPQSEDLTSPPQNSQEWGFVQPDFWSAVKVEGTLYPDNPEHGEAFVFLDELPDEFLHAIQAKLSTAQNEGWQHANVWVHDVRVEPTSNRDTARPLSVTESREFVNRLSNELGVPEAVAEQLAGGVTFPAATSIGRGVYIAGPMRGHPNFNFEAFDEARDFFVSKGWTVISPADIDRAAGINPASDTSDQRPFVLRDFYALFILHPKFDAVAMLPGWENSAGALAEFCLARWLGLPILDHKGEPLVVVDGFNIHARLSEYLLNQ